MPASGEAVAITSTPDGETGCTSIVQGVVVTTSLHRDGLHWRAGQTWVDGTPTAPGDVQSAIAAVKAKRDVEESIAAAEAVAITALTKAKETGRELLDRFKK
jgi:hypothetical protein